MTTDHSQSSTADNTSAETIETIAPSTSLQFDMAKKVNFASAQNDIPVLKTLSITNMTDGPLDNIQITLTAQPAVIKSRTWIIDRLSPMGSFELGDLATPLDVQKLAGLNETEIGSLTLTASTDDGPLSSETLPLELLARDQWGGLGDMDRLLAAFVSPNDPVVAAILKEASLLLERSGHDGSLEGYQSGDPQRAWMIAGAIWSAVTGMGLTYANPPASFEVEGQKIRAPERIRSEGLATCLDSSLLLAAAWEQAGLHPVVLFSRGHAWAGVWITNRDFGHVTEPDVITVRKATHAKEFIPVETTLLTQRPTAGFEQAVEAGRSRVSEDREQEFLMAVDITRARSARIRPLASHVAADAGVAEHIEAAPTKLPDPIDFGLLPSEVIEQVPDTPKGRIERWQAKLLDLSLRNRLLNFKPSKQTVPCLVPDVGALEDALAADKAFRAYPLMEDDPIGERQLSRQDRDEIIASATKDAFERGQITMPLDRKDADNRLLTLFRKAKSDLQEGGTNTLFLAAGFLRWQREGEKRSYRAPLLLIPIKLERKSARSDFRILHHEDEVRFNSTLLEFLKRDFDLTLPELEGELPRDDSGIDLPRIFEWMRQRVREVPGFEVVEEIAISTFSFSKYLMWKDLVERTDQLRNNRLVAHLVDNPDKTFEGGAGDAIPAEQMDHKLAPKDLVTPLPADSSQLSAVVAAAEGRDFVLIGPPGTGKSQTIANIICQCLAHGKTVLFVAEKAAALDVVQRRLEAHGLGDAVLELHSNKTDRKRVLTQLGRGWDRASATNEQDWLDITEKLRIKRDQLNTYVQAVHAKGAQGFSVFDAISWTAGAPKGLKLSFADKDAHDQHSFDRLLEITEELGRTYMAVGGGTPLPLVGEAEWSHAWEDQIIDQVKTLRTCIDRAMRSSSDLAGQLALSPDRTLMPERRALLTGLSRRIDPDADDLRMVPRLSERDLHAEVDQFETALVAFMDAQDQCSASYTEDNMKRLPLDQLDAEWRAGVAGFWPFSALKKRKTRKLLQTYASSGQVEPGRDLPALEECRKQLAVLQDSPVADTAGADRSLHRLKGRVAQAISLRATLAGAQSEINDTVAFGATIAALEEGPTGELRQAMEDWQAADSALNATITEFAGLGGLVDTDLPLRDLLEAVDQTLAQRGRLADWTRWVAIRNKAKAAGLTPLVDAIEADQLKGDPVAECRSAYARWWLPLAMDASDPLRQFAHWEHEDIVAAFRKLDDEVAEHAPREVMRRIHHRLPARDGVPRKSELGVLRHQLGLKRPSMAIRPLLENLGDVLPKLAPCVLMSPLSIAQYLPAGQATFDVVIFDEASQITTWDAIGAIARAKQSIIVGDPKQLPPTNFFGRSDEAEEDAEGMIGDMPSILDEVATAGIPTRRLDWHYRSRDEALIAFSNHFYYDGGLVTFPAPSTGSEAVTFHKIDGTYARGAGRTNADEAKAIVALIRQRLTAWLNHPEEDRPTLGVITFNAQQQGLILDLLDKVRRDAPELEWFFAEEREEPVIVKNLENIQGDERDVMLFSITFAPDLAGKLSMNFGALNADGGEKRLNVAVTRARRELHVFASLTHDQIDLSRTRATGVRDLKTFLDYAERGPVALAAREEGSLGPAENPFEQAIAEAFRAKGWEVRTQIGVSGFRIDLGIVNPDRAGAYLAGIECDGATYHSSATARDRDKVRQAVLEGLGWTILRIWSTDWFRDPAAVVDRLHERLEALLEEDRAARQEAELEVAEEDLPEVRALPAPEPPQADSVPPEPKPEEVDGSQTFASRVQAPELHKDDGPKADPDRFFDLGYLGVLRQIVHEVLVDQAPMPLRNLGREVANRHGWQRTGRRIMDRVEHALGAAELHDEFGTPFVWLAGTYQDRIPYRGLENRAIRDVSRTEVAAVLDEIGADLKASEDPAGDLARHLGLSRVSGSARQQIEEIIRWYEDQTGNEDSAHS
ncbi:DUF3320 domain-containing protein [Ruegeria sp. HKCCD7559]|nr:DUF3320 domain-containing protein [Ruegeria sp. HKCCD7559]